MFNGQKFTFANVNAIKIALFFVYLIEHFHEIDNS